MVKYVISAWLFLFSLTSFGENFVAGTDYEIIKNGATLEKPKSAIPVTEFFSFGCHWCYRLEAPLNRWLSQKGSEITFTKTPVIFNKDWEYYAKAYYTASALSLNQTLDPLLFKTIIVDKKSLNSNQSMIHFFTQNGVDLPTAESAFLHSPRINLQISESQALMARYHIAAVPAFIVNDQYKTDLQMAKTEDRLLAIVDFLIIKAKT